MMRSFICLLTLYLGVLHTAFAQHSSPCLSTTGKRRSATTLVNPCGLHADCTPEQDTAVVTGSLTLKNTTIGADAYEWIDDSYSSFPKPNEDLLRLGE